MEFLYNSTLPLGFSVFGAVGVGGAYLTAANALATGTLLGTVGAVAVVPLGVVSSGIAAAGILGQTAFTLNYLLTGTVNPVRVAIQKIAACDLELLFNPTNCIHLKYLRSPWYETFVYKENIFCARMQYEDAIFKYKCDYSPHFEFLQKPTTELTKTNISLFNKPLDFCFTNSIPEFFTCESIQTENSILNYLKGIASFCNDNAHVFLIASLAFVVGYGLWRYFSLNTEQPHIPSSGSQEGVTLVNLTPTSSTRPTQLLTNELEPETEHPPANPMDDTAVEAVVEQIQPTSNEVLRLLNEQASNQEEFQQFVRTILEEVVQRVIEISIINGPAVEVAVTALSQIPNHPL